MKNYLIISLIIAGVVSVTSCKKILNPSSPNQVATGDLFTSVQGLQEARTGMYATLEAKNYYGGVYPLLTECYTDNGTCGGYNAIDLNDIIYRSMQTSNLYVDGMYTAMYNSIFAANKILENAANVPGADADLIATTTGEAYFVRGLAEFDLLRTYGEYWDLSSSYGISIVTSTANPTAAVARSSVADSYTQVISDLNKAVSSISGYQGNMYASPSAAKALLARVYLYKGDKANAAAMSADVIADGNFALYNSATFTSIYTQKNTTESVFELVFDPQNQSYYNILTYVRNDATLSDVDFVAAPDLNDFFTNRPDDLRSQLVDFSPDDNDISILPNGRTQKYRGEATKDNSAYVIRLAEVYLIHAEAVGKTKGLADLNTLREARGMNDLKSSDVSTDAKFLNAVLDERRAELNFEGHRLFDLGRTGKLAAVLGADVNPIMPIPQREISATNGVVAQNPGY